MIIISVLLVTGSLSIVAIGAPTASVKDYIVVLKDHLSARDVSDHFTWAHNVHSSSLSVFPRSLKPPAGIDSNFTLGGGTAYTGSFSDAAAASLRRSADIAHFEEDVVERRQMDEDEITYARPDPQRPSSAESRPNIEDPNILEQPDAPPQLVRISHAKPRDGENVYLYHKDGTGRGMFAYVLAEGVNREHEQFEEKQGTSRVERGKNTYSMKTHADRMGHGTALAGVIGGKSTGVLKDVTIIDVKIADMSERRLSKLLLALEWTLNDIKANNRLGKAVVTFEGFFSTPQSGLLDRLVERVHNEGVLCVVPAGDKASEVKTSPGNNPFALTVGGINNKDGIWLEKYPQTGSDLGGTVAIYAPSQEISVPWKGADDKYETLSSTVLAAGYVTGVALYFMQLEATREPPRFDVKNVRAVKDKLFEESQLNAIQFIPEHFPNRLLYNKGANAMK